MFDVIKIAGGFAVVDHTGAQIVGYRDRKTTEQVCRGYILGMYAAAETYDERRTYCRAYLASRANRVPATVNQLELF